MINLDQLVPLLNKKYLNRYNAKIVGGFQEPFYRASKNNKPAEIQYTYDYIRSALHELSHWCVAGVERRKLDDYGYWYAQDGRTQDQQDEFFKVELKPQSIEWVFCIACGIKFEASVDNLHNQVAGVDLFNQKLLNQMYLYIQNGLPLRVYEIAQLLTQYLHGKNNINELIDNDVSLN